MKLEDTFRYVTITHKLVSEISHFLARGESVVVLGHRNSGKVFLRDKVQKNLEGQKFGPIISIKFQDAYTISSEAEAFQRICEGVRASTELELTEYTRGQELLQPVLKLGQDKGKMPILLATNVDAMSHVVARQFLQEVRAAVNSNKIVAFLTGAYDLRELVFGPSSEFNVANHFVLQGFGPEYFAELGDSYAGALNITFESSEAREELWRITGGNGYALRVLLWVIVEWRTRNKKTNEPIEADLIRSWIKRTPIMGPDEAHLLRSAIRLIPLEPKTWDHLRRLTVDKVTQVKDPSGPPSALTLSGIAKLKPNGLLEFASPLTEELVCRYYDDLRLGDLYARAGRWKEAFELYRKVEPNRRLRPSSSEDRPDVDAVIQSLCASLHSEAELGAEPVYRLFALGCRYVLGFPEIALWRKKIQPESTLDQELVALVPEYPPSTLAKEAARQTLTETNYRPGPIPVAANWQRSAFALALEPLSSDSFNAVLVGDFETKRPVSPQRESFFNELARHFVQAHAYATSVEKDRLRLRFRNRQANIINGILARLGQDVLNVGDILQRAAEALRSLGYRRIGFCLVDPKSQRAEGVWDASDDPSVNLAKMTNWPLEGEYVDIHKKVIREAKFEIIKNARPDLLTNNETVTTVKLKASAVIPILDYSDRAIGTIVIERLDQMPPSQDEVLDFLDFGRQLAAVIEQGERVNLMQCSLDQIPEPLLVVDPVRTVRYANRKASQLFAIPAGWKGRNDGSTLAEAEDFNTTLTAALEGRRSFHHFTGVRNDKDYRGARLCAPISDWRARVVGAVLHIEDLNYVFKLLRAFEVAARASSMESLRQALCQALSRFGHEWGRIYLIEGDADNKALVRKQPFGFVDYREPARLPWKPEAQYWLCLKEKTPQIFCDTNSNTAKKYDPLGGTVISQSDFFANPSEIRGTAWIDFPLVTPRRELGKITLQIGKDLTLEHYEFLKVLCEMASELLEAFLRREDADRMAGLIRAEAAQLSLAKFSHNIATRFAGLDPMINRYRNREKLYPQLKEINDELEQGFRGIVSVVNQAKEKLRVLQPNVRHMNANLYFAKEMKRLANEMLSLNLSPMVLWIQGDEELLTDALGEIVHNAKQATRNQLQIHADLNIVESEGREYVRFVIEDNGPGVEDHYKEKIFEMFFTHHPGGEPGTGLGLNMVRRVFQAHEGWARETGVYGKGARFELGIPRLVAE